jgi:phage recombination protein Bet
MSASTAVATVAADLVPAPDWEAQELLPTIRHMCARGATDPEFKIFVATARLLGLNPMLKQVWCVKNENRPDLPAQIYASRDGFLAIAHRSGQFDGMQSGVKKNDQGEDVGWCRIYRRDMSHPFEVEILRSEYDTGKSLWQTKPQTMTVKVAEAHCLRRAFDICGVYTPDEMPEPEPAPMREVRDTSRPAAPVAAPKTSTNADRLPGATPQKPSTAVEPAPRAAIHDPAGGDPTTCGGCGCTIDAAPGGYIVPVEGHGWRCIPCRDAILKAAAPEPAPAPAPEPKKPEPAPVAKAVPKAPPKVPKQAASGAVCETCGKEISNAEEKTSRLFCSKPLCTACIQRA